MKPLPPRTLCALLLATAAGGAQAHVVLQQRTAEAGASIKAAFVVSHGCGQETTRAIIVKVPDGIANARPMVKPNWIITTRKAGERVAEVAWRGGAVAPELYDEFVIVMRVPDTPGKRYYFTVRQECELGLAERGPGNHADSLRAWGPFRNQRLERVIQDYEQAASAYAEVIGIKLDP